MVTKTRVFAAAAAMVALVLAVSCGSGSASPTSSTPPTPSPAATGAVTDPTDSYEPGPGAQFLLDGASTVTQADATYSYTITSTLPTGNTAVTTYTVDPKPVPLGTTSSLPDSPLYGLQFSHALGADGMDWSYSYIVPADSFPADAIVLASLDSGTVPRARHFLQPAKAYAAEGDGVKVVVTGLLKEFGKEGAAQIEEHAGLAESPVTEGASSILEIAEALDKSAEYQKLMKRIADLRDCAENPTNPLTQKLYADDPGARQRILDEVDRVAAETKMDMAVRFIGALNSTAGGLAGAKWLGFIVGPVTSWADNEIAWIGKERVDKLEQLVPKCGAVIWNGTITYQVDFEDSTDYTSDDDGSRWYHDSGTESRHYEATVTFEGLVLQNPQNAFDSQLSASGSISDGRLHATGSAEETSAEDQKCADGSLVGFVEEDSFNGSLDDEEATVVLSVFQGTYTLTASGNALIMEGESVTHYSAGCPDEDGNREPPYDESREKTRGAGSPNVSVKGDYDPAHLSGSQTLTDEDGAITTITWSLDRQ